MAELPWLKNKNKKMGGGGAIERKAEATHEDSMGDDLMDQVAGELLSAIEKKDVKGVKEALTALFLNIQDEDQEQDSQEEAAE